MANLQAIAIGIFEKDRVVSWAFIITRAFDIASACSDNDICKPVDVVFALGPERNAALVRNMAGVFRDAEKLPRLDTIGGFEL